MLDNKSKVLEMIKSGNGFEIEELSKKLQNDKDIMLALVKHNGYNLQFLPEVFKSDKEIVMMACRTNEDALNFASNDLLDDESFLLDLTSLIDVSLVYSCFSKRLSGSEDFIYKLLEKYNQYHSDLLFVFAKLIFDVNQKMIYPIWKYFSTLPGDKYLNLAFDLLDLISKDNLDNDSELKNIVLKIKKTRNN